MILSFINYRYLRLITVIFFLIAFSMPLYSLKREHSSLFDFFCLEAFIISSKMSKMRALKSDLNSIGRVLQLKLS